MCIVLIKCNHQINQLWKITFENDKHPSSSSLFILKSYNALHCGIWLGSDVGNT